MAFNSGKVSVSVLQSTRDMKAHKAATEIQKKERRKIAGMYAKKKLDDIKTTSV